jgi:hypothetical protein
MNPLITSSVPLSHPLAVGHWDKHPESGTDLGQEVGQ